MTVDPLVAVAGGAAVYVAVASLGPRYAQARRRHLRRVERRQIVGPHVSMKWRRHW